MRTLGTTTVRALTDHWGHGPEDWGLPADTDPSSTVYVTETDDGGIRLEVEVAGQEHLPVHDRETRYIPSPDGGIDGFATADLPPGAINPTAYARMHYDADSAALGSGETLDADKPVAWLTGVEDPPGDEDWQAAVAREYRRLRDEHGGRKQKTLREAIPVTTADDPRGIKLYEDEESGVTVVDDGQHTWAADTEALEAALEQPWPVVDAEGTWRGGRWVASTGSLDAYSELCQDVQPLDPESDRVQAACEALGFAAEGLEDGGRS